MNNNTRVIMKMKYPILLTIIVFFCSACIFPPPPTPTTTTGTIATTLSTSTTLPPNPLKVVSTHHYVKGNGWYHITGKILNDGKVPLKHVRAKVSIVTSNGVEEEWDDRVVFPSRLDPGQAGAFDMTVGEEDEYTIGEYTVDPDTSVEDTSEPYKQISVSGVSHIEEQGFYKVKATFKNTGEKQAPSYGTVAIFYDGDGKVLAIGAKSIMTSDGGLNPGETLESTFINYHPNKEERIVDYEVVVDYSP